MHGWCVLCLWVCMSVMFVYGCMFVKLIALYMYVYIWWHGEYVCTYVMYVCVSIHTLHKSNKPASNTGTLDRAPRGLADRRRVVWLEHWYGPKGRFQYDDVEVGDEYPQDWYNRGYLPKYNRGIGIKNGIIDGALTPKRHYRRMEEYN